MRRKRIGGVPGSYPVHLPGEESEIRSRQSTNPLTASTRGVCVMANDEKETKKTPGDGDIDKEVGLDDVLKDGDKIAVIHNDTPKDRSNKLKYLKNTLFVLLLAVVGLTVIGVSFKVGEKIFFAYKTMDKDSLQENTKCGRPKNR
jgi:hypothetical protein